MILLSVQQQQHELVNSSHITILIQHTELKHFFLTAIIFKQTQTKLGFVIKIS